MNEKARIGLIFGSVALVLGGGLFYFFKVYQPKQQQGAAQSEVLAWEERWTEARACLLGRQPVSSSSRESLAIREMQPDPWERKTCTKLIGQLSRGVAEDTGLMNVEHAWMTLDRAAGKVANAFATHVDPFGEAPEARGKDSPLPEALEALDAAHADLRKVTGLAPPESAKLPALPTAEIIRVADGADVVSSRGTWSLPSAGGFVGHGSTKNGEVQVVFKAGAAPRVLRVPADAVRAVPDLAWAATGLLSEIAIAPIDDKGAFGATTNLPVPNGGDVIVAAGTFTAGVLTYIEDRTLTIARAAGGPFVADKPIAMDRFTSAIDPAGRVLVAWNGPDGGDPDGAQLHGFISRGDAAPKIVALGAGYAGRACLTATHGWVGDAAQVVSFDDTAAVPHVLPEHTLLGCTTDSALLHKTGTSHYVVCTQACRIVDMTNLKSTHVATVAGGKVQAIRARAGVLGVWRENAPPVFYATAATLTPRLAISDGKVIDVVATTDDGVVIARVPLR